MADTFLQIRTNKEDKQAASEILASLGTNLSTVLNMTIKQIILRRGIPFDVSLDNAYNPAIRNTLGTMEIEGMALLEEEKRELIKFETLSSEEQEQDIQRSVSQYTEASNG